MSTRLLILKKIEHWFLINLYLIKKLYTIISLYKPLLVRLVRGVNIFYISTWWCLGFYSLILIHYRFKVVRFSNLKYALYSTLREKFIFVIYFAVNAHLFENPSFSQRLIKRIISLREIPCLAYPGFSSGQGSMSNWHAHRWSVNAIHSAMIGLWETGDFLRS